MAACRGRRARRGAGRVGDILAAAAARCASASGGGADTGRGRAGVPYRVRDRRQTSAEHVPTSLTVFRLADNPRILVLDFASLHEQGEMLNRVAAFVEKAGTAA